MAEEQLRSIQGNQGGQAAEEGTASRQVVRSDIRKWTNLWFVVVGGLLLLALYWDISTYGFSSLFVKTKTFGNTGENPNNPPAGATGGQQPGAGAPRVVQPQWPATGVWIELIAPPVGEEPKCFPTRPGTQTAPGFASKKDEERVERVGAIVKDGKIYTPGQACFRSKDDIAVKMWVKFTL